MPKETLFKLPAYDVIGSTGHFECFGPVSNTGKPANVQEKEKAMRYRLEKFTYPGNELHPFVAFLEENRTVARMYQDDNGFYFETYNVGRIFDWEELVDARDMLDR